MKLKKAKGWRILIDAVGDIRRHPNFEIFSKAILAGHQYVGGRVIGGSEEYPIIDLAVTLAIAPMDPKGPEYELDVLELVVRDLRKIFPNAQGFYFDDIVVTLQSRGLFVYRKRLIV